MNRVDWLCVAWASGLAFSMCIFAMPNWEEPALHVVKVRQVPTVIPKPQEVVRP